MRPQVEYVLREFDLKIPQQAFEFLFQLYNFVSTVKELSVNSAGLRMASCWRKKSTEASNPLLVESLRAPDVRAIKGAMRMVD